MRKFRDVRKRDAEILRNNNNKYINHCSLSRACTRSEALINFARITYKISFLNVTMRNKKKYYNMNKRKKFTH